MFQNKRKTKYEFPELNPNAKVFRDLALGRHSKNGGGAASVHQPWALDFFAHSQVLQGMYICNALGGGQTGGTRGPPPAGETGVAVEGHSHT